MHVILEKNRHRIIIVFDLIRFEFIINYRRRAIHRDFIFELAAE